MAEVKLAEALLRRKELQEKVEQLRAINNSDLIKIGINRKKVTEDIDEIVSSVPIVSISEVTRAYDWHARRLREVDAAIQQANWSTAITVPDDVMKDYEPPEMLDDDRMNKRRR